MRDAVSSRTPEGEPNICPICRSEICIEPSQRSGDAPCPRCGALLWFVRTENGVSCHPADRIASLREKVRALLRRFRRGSPEDFRESAPFIADSAGDSLEAVELVMELEEEFDIVIPDKHAAQIQTVAKALDYIARHLG